MLNCIICNQHIDSTKGIAKHLKIKHNMTTKQYYDTYIKSENEGICPICGKPTKYYNFTRGYNTHCSTRCSSLDPIVQQKLKQTNQSLYNVDVGFQTELCIKNSHSEETMKKHKQTMLHNGWKRSKLEETLIDFFDTNNIKYLHNQNTVQYPWKCDFYLPSLDLYIEVNGYWTHGGHFFTNSKSDKIQLSKWKQLEQKYRYSNAIKVWTDYDVKKKKCVIKNNLNYVVLWNKNQLNQFITEFKDKEFIGFIDYNGV